MRRACCYGDKQARTTRAGVQNNGIGMQTRLSRRDLLTGLVAAAAAGFGAAGDARAADFYQGKTLTVIVGYAPGGGVDATARAITRHLGKFIPGQPNIVVQNMEGAAGIISVNHLDRRVAPDGLTLAIPGRSWYIEAIVKRPGITFDPTKLTYIGSPGAVSAAAFVRSSTGIKTFDELKASPKTITFGALGGTTPTAMAPALLAANGAPIKVVLGYVSTARVLFALEQGEVDASFTVGNALASRADLFSKVVPIVQTGTSRPGIPNLRDVVPARQGPIVDLIMAPDNLGVPLIGPAGMPPDITEVLRKAFIAMAQDKAYQADALNVELPVGTPIDGGQLAAMMNALAAATTPDVAAEFSKLAGAK
jgi:tripartite-type tricarboxylate transporter receptor subunit TctC